MGIKKKLLFAFLLASAVPAIVCLVTFYFSSRVTSLYASISSENVPNLEAFIDMKGAAVGIQIPVASLIETNSTKEQADNAMKDLRGWLEKFDKAAKAYESSPFSEGEEPVWKEYRNGSFKRYVEMSIELIRLSGTGNKADGLQRDKLFHNDYQDLIKERVKGFEDVVGFQVRDEQKTREQAESAARQMNTIVVFIVVLGVFGTMLLGFVIARSLARQLDELSNALTASSDEVRAATDLLSDGSEKLASASHQQAASVQETSAALEEISAMVDRNSQGAKDSTRLSEEARSKADEGKDAVNRVISAVEEIRESKERIKAQIDTGNQKIAEIANVIRDIGEKTKVINDIVFQTKLLSFNASVEAARAGEYGKGFAVVAEEVGNLAAMSGGAAKEISNLLEASTRQVEQVIRESKESVTSLMNEVDQRVQSGTSVAQVCGTSLDEIVVKIGLLGEAVQAIAVASSEQSGGVQEISKAMREIDSATQLNSTVSQQTSTAAQQLAGEVSRVVDSAVALKQIVDGNKARAHQGRPSGRTKKLAPVAQKPSVKVAKEHAEPKFSKVSETVPSADHPSFEDDTRESA